MRDGDGWPASTVGPIPPGKLAFHYSEDEMAQIRAGELPERIAKGMIQQHGTAWRRDLLALGIRFAIFVVLFGIGTTRLGVWTGGENSQAFGLLMLGVAIAIAILAVPGLALWRKYRSQAAMRRVRMMTAHAIVESSNVVRFTSSAARPAWRFSESDVQTIEDKGRYRIYWADDRLVYLEPVNS